MPISAMLGAIMLVLNVILNIILILQRHYCLNCCVKIEEVVTGTIFMLHFDY